MPEYVYFIFLNFMKIYPKAKRRTIVVTATLSVLSTIALAITLILINNLQNKIALTQLKTISDRTESENSSFDEQLNINLNLISSLVQTGIFSKSENNKWSSAVATVLESNRNITAISAINKNGTEYYASLEDSVLEFYVINDKNSSETKLFYQQLSSEKLVGTDTIIPVRAINLKSYMDHIAEKVDTVVWYNIQPVPGINKELGRAASIKTLEKASGDEIIITIYVSIQNIYQFLQRIAGTVNAELCLFTPDNKIFDIDNLPANQHETDFSNYLIELDSSQSTLYKEAILKWKSSGLTDSLQFISFRYENQKYWGALRKVKQKTTDLWIALILPEDDFLTILNEKIGILFFIPVLILLISILVLIIVIRRNFYSYQRKDFPETSEILKLIEKGEDEHIEFKSTVRTNLFTNKPGKEIELAWLKSVVGFCNSMGGTILIGVSDSGEILGLEPDNFANDDKCLLHVQNLIRDHIGMEFTKYINYRLISQGEKKILVVNCMMATEPLFLMSSGKEQFYVRSGPASIELPMSKALKYIKDRKNE